MILYFPDKLRGLPRRVRAAMQFVEFCRSITDPGTGEFRPAGRALTARERAAYDAAVETIRAYVIGELELSEEPAAGEPANQ
jgi:hypothetical protein